jgi:hypothetical protein
MAEHPEACAEWRDDVAAWVVAQIEPGREAALSAHLASCHGCRTEAESLLGVAAIALVADPDHPVTDDPAPPVDLGDRIASRIAAERRGTVVRRSALAAVGGAAAAVVVVVALTVAGDGGPAALEGERFAFSLGTGEAVVADDPDTDGSLVELTASGLDPEVTYALWLSVPGGGRDERVPAGTFTPDDDGTVEVRLASPMSPEETGRVWATTGSDLALDTE